MKIEVLVPVVVVTLVMGYEENQVVTWTIVVVVTGFKTVVGEDEVTIDVLKPVEVTY